MASLRLSVRGVCACALNRVVTKMESVKKQQSAACPRRVAFHRRRTGCSMSKKGSCSRATPEDFYDVGARKFGPLRLPKRFGEKSAFSKRRVCHGENIRGTAAYIAKSADFAKPIHATVTTRERTIWVSLKTRNLKSLSPAGPSPAAILLKARPNHRDLARQILLTAICGPIILSSVRPA